MIYVATALSVAKIERKLLLKKSFFLFLFFQFAAFSSLFLIKNKWQLLTPFLLVGIAQGGWWPLIEGAMCDKQNMVQKKRAISIFNFSWVFGLIIGPSIAGVLYSYDKMLPLWVGMATISTVFIMLLIPKSLEISNWKMLQEKDLEAPATLPLFIKLGVCLNLISYLFIGSFRSVLVEFTVPLGLSATQYGVIQATLNIGLLTFMFCLMKFHFWQFSKKGILVAIALMFSLITAFAFSSEYYTLVLISFLIGAPVALFYFSSLFYGMLGAKSGSDHGGHHEAMIGAGQSLGPLISGYMISLQNDPRSMFYWIILIFVGLFFFVQAKTRVNNLKLATGQ